MLNIKKMMKLKKYKKIIQKSNFFDVKYYLKVNHDARISNETPLNHFCKIGLEKDRKPNKNFNPSWYKSFYPDVNESNLYPLIHFIRYGLYENRFMNEEEAKQYKSIKESKLFNEKYYINSYSDLQEQEEDFDFLLHYIRHGEKEGRKPNKNFNPSWYKNFYLDLKTSNISSLFHFIMYGKSENRLMNKEEDIEYKTIKSSKLFDVEFYKNRYKDLGKRGKDFDFLLHYIRYGEKEGRKPNVLFNPEWYLNNNLDLKYSNIKPLLHYIKFGEKNKRNPGPLFDIKWYLENYSTGSIENQPLKHFLSKGLVEKKSPYKDFNKDLEDSNMNALEYLTKYCTTNHLLKLNNVENKNFNQIFNESLPKKDIATTLNIAIVVEIITFAKLEELIQQVLLIPYEYKIYFVIESEEKEFLVKKLNESNLLNFEIMNKTLNEDSFLSLLPYLKKSEYDIVCNIRDIQSLFTSEDNKLWYDMLLKSILGSSSSIFNIIKAFENDKNLGIIGSADFYKSAQKLMSVTDKKLMTKVLETVDTHYDFAQDWGYFGGNIFWARVSLFNPLIENNSFTKLIKTEEELTRPFLLEKVFGTLLTIQKMNRALIYGIDIERKNHVVEIISKESFSPSPLGIETTLANEKDIHKNYNFLKENRSFDSLFYLKQRPIIKEFTIHPVLDFLRYGVYQNISPNKDFSPFSYWSLSDNKIIYKSNPLVYFLQAERNEVVMPCEDNYIFAREKIKKSKLFDSHGYHLFNPDVQSAGVDPLTHYCKYGWKEDREIKSEIDVLWYRNEYLSNELSPVNPLLHYILIGKKRGYLKKPNWNKELTLKSTPLTRNSKRISLFAGYDVDGLIDDSVILFVKELSRHSDVYFLSDSELQDGELDKLQDFVKGAWGIRHGEYDFGSYKRLACYLVGWDKIEEYDELILVNDSSYLLKSLDEMFEKMNAKDCSWWGAQATKGISATKDKRSNQFSEKIPMSEVKSQYLTQYMEEDEYDFLLGSYFLAFRKNILLKNELKSLLSGVKKERNKKNIILKYEIGLTKGLILKGYDFDTVVDDLYPFHPIYTNKIFELIKEGYPFFKRFFLTENHYHVPNLWQWKDKLVELVPSLDLKPIESNLYRIADAGKLQTNLNIKADGSNLLLTDEEFIEKDKQSIVEENHWAFPVCAFDYTFSGNERAVFEEVKDNPNIKKIILFRGKKIELDGVNIEFIPLLSREGQEALLLSNVIFIKHTAYRNAVYPLNPKKHKFINLWHGIPLKRIGAASLDLQSNMKALIEEHKKLYSVIASSSIDRMAMATAFYPLTYNDVWVTGLPRNDFILKEENLLPIDFKNDLTRLEKLINGKKFILYAPTFRNAQSDGYYHFSSEEKSLLHSYLKKNNIILGIREHMADKAHSYSQELKGECVINVGGNNFSNIEILYRKADLLITDYSSCFIDFMLTGKPMISFAFDYENYTKEERGLFYSLEFAFAGKICEDFDSLFSQIKKVMSEENYTISESYQNKQKIFFDHLDAENAKRVVDKVINNN